VVETRRANRGDRQAGWPALGPPLARPWPALGPPLARPWPALGPPLALPGHRLPGHRLPGHRLPGHRSPGRLHPVAWSPGPQSLRGRYRGTEPGRLVSVPSVGKRAGAGGRWPAGWRPAAGSREPGAGSREPGRLGGRQRSAQAPLSAPSAPSASKRPSAQAPNRPRGQALKRPSASPYHAERRHAARSLVRRFPCCVKSLLRMIVDGFNHLQIDVTY